ncbi:MAG TPA: glycogen-binding domain-containing protein [Gemmatimonadaceae bacterium]|nr:glycogen-binding domain-containing protein [Gemmatimonadaceae bacterium]
MSEPKAAIIAISLALLVPHAARAQIASRLEAGSLTTQQDGDVPASTINVSPGIRVDLPYLAFSAKGSAWLTGQQWQIADGSISGSLLTPTAYGLRGEIIGTASRAFYDRSLQNDQVDAQARLHLLFAKQGGIWLGGGLARPWRVAVTSAVDVAGGGAWRRFGNATVSGTFTNFFFTKAASQDSSGTAISCSTRSDPLPTASTTASANVSASSTSSSDCRRQSHFSDVEASVNWAHGWLEMTAQTGYRFGNAADVTADSRRWAAGSAVVWLTDRMAAVAGGGRVPANPTRGLPARNYVNFGIMLAYNSIPRSSVPVAPRAAVVRAFEVRQVNAGTQKITVQVGGVETVEVMGDFSDWAPLLLIRRGRDLWDITIPVSPGVHQLNVRVDGGPWLPPPGLPAMRDGFSGEVGLFVAP